MNSLAQQTDMTAKSFALLNTLKQGKAVLQTSVHRAALVESREGNLTQERCEIFLSSSDVKIALPTKIRGRKGKSEEI